MVRRPCRETTALCSVLDTLEFASFRQELHPTTALGLSEILLLFLVS